MYFPYSDHKVDSPFHRWYQQSDNSGHAFQPSPLFGGGIPVYPVEPTYDTRRPSHPPQHQKPGPKLVQIPVRFVGSDPEDRPGSALKIQKVFRAYLVRKSLKKIRNIKAQVDEIEVKLSRSEVVELIQRDGQEKLRVNETLMALLFKLDSVRGIDSGVRDCRKAVIRKAIALQERVDAIAAAPATVNFAGGSVESNREEQEVRVPAGIDNSSQLGDGPKELGNCVDIYGEVDCCVEIPEILDGSVREMVDVNCIDGGDNHTMEVEEGKDDGEIEMVDVGVYREVKLGESNCKSNGTCENLDEQNEENMKYDLIEIEEKEKIGGDWVEVESEGKATEGNAENYSSRNQELMEQMIKDNEKLMSLMMQLVEKNETQTRMINALTHRVELLEKAFVCDRLRKKKKKAAACRED